MSYSDAISALSATPVGQVVGFILVLPVALWAILTGNFS